MPAPVVRLPDSPPAAVEALTVDGSVTDLSDVPLLAALPDARQAAARGGHPGASRRRGRVADARGRPARVGVRRAQRPARGRGRWPGGPRAGARCGPRGARPADRRTPLGRRAGPARLVGARGAEGRVRRDARQRPGGDPGGARPGRRAAADRGRRRGRGRPTHPAGGRGRGRPAPRQRRHRGRRGAARPPGDAPVRDRPRRGRPGRAGAGRAATTTGCCSLSDSTGAAEDEAWRDFCLRQADAVVLVARSDAALPAGPVTPAPLATARRGAGRAGTLARAAGGLGGRDRRLAADARRPGPGRRPPGAGRPAGRTLARPGARRRRRAGVRPRRGAARARGRRPARRPAGRGQHRRCRRRRLRRRARRRGPGRGLLHRVRPAPTVQRLASSDPVAVQGAAGAHRAGARARRRRGPRGAARGSCTP